MEPAIVGKSGRFAILTHDHPFFHWDLLLEVETVAWTWRLTDHFGATQFDTTEQLDAERIGDHRLHYLTYEGPVSGDRGRVVRVDEGHFRIVHETATHAQVLLSGRCGERLLLLPRNAS